MIIVLGRDKTLGEDAALSLMAPACAHAHRLRQQREPVRVHVPPCNLLLAGGALRLTEPSHATQDGPLGLYALVAPGSKPGCITAVPEPPQAGPRAGKRSVCPGTSHCFTHASGSGIMDTAHSGSTICAVLQSRSGDPLQSCHMPQLSLCFGSCGAAWQHVPASRRLQAVAHHSVVGTAYDSPASTAPLPPSQWPCEAPGADFLPLLGSASNGVVQMAPAQVPVSPALSYAHPHTLPTHQTPHPPTSGMRYRLRPQPQRGGGGQQREQPLLAGQDAN